MGVKEPSAEHVRNVLLVAFMALYVLVWALIPESTFSPGTAPSGDAPASFPASTTPHG